MTILRGSRAAVTSVLASALAVTLVCTWAPSARAQSRVSSRQDVAVGTQLASVRADGLLAQPVTVRFTRVPLRRAIELIAEHAAIRISYRGELLDAIARPVTLNAEQVPLGEVLDQVLVGTRLHASQSAQGVVIKEDVSAIAPVEGVVTGKVTNARTNQPVASASILVDDATKGVLTDAGGAFRLTLAPGTHTLTIRALGFVKQVKQISVTEEKTTVVEISLSPGTSVLDEVVVTGTVVATERRAIPTPITVITADDIEKRGITRIEQLFRGEIPGVIAAELGSLVYEGAVATTSKVYVRGSASLDGSPNPLKTYIDGVELADPAYLGTIDPKTIERIEIITGPQAATIYGSGAMGGVMQIFTKRGSANGAFDFTLGLKYGMLESNLSNGRTPVHNHSLTMNGGSGPDFSYSGTLSYNYSGQWQPLLFSRLYGASVGARHTRGPVALSATFASTRTGNGQTNQSAGVTLVNRVQSGELVPYTNWGSTVTLVQSKASTTSQTGGGTVDYTVSSIWQHHLTGGWNATKVQLLPTQPRYQAPYDTTYYVRINEVRRTSASYNTTLAPPRLGALSTTLTLGVNGSWNDGQSISGSRALGTTSTALISPYVQPVDGRTAGGFANWQTGLLDQLFFTFALRGERNPNYGTAHKIDWTPRTGVTYAREMGDVTVKLLASYGRATRPPTDDQRQRYESSSSETDPSSYLYQLDAPNLTPEYSRGPEGGIELYYGNLGSLTINRYDQRVTDLIQSVRVDSVYVRYLDGSYEYWSGIYQNQNVASIRQRGWEGTASLNLGPVTLGGTYSWTDARVTSVNPSSYSSFKPGEQFYNVPNHAGSARIGYARGGTSLTLVTNYIGARIGEDNTNAQVYIEPTFSRLKMYVSRRKTDGSRYVVPGYAKSDLSASQRLTSSVSATLNVTNLANSFGSESFIFNPSLGRTTTLGLSVRFPR